MMRGTGGALAVAVAALLVCCSADPHPEQDVSGNDRNTAEVYDAGHKTGTVDSLSGNLVRAVREIRRSGYVPYLVSRRYAYPSPYGGGVDELPKRNFDEIDRPNTGNYVEGNFDEIDASGLPFPYNTKRAYGTYNLDTPVSGLDTFVKRNFDEIDRSNMPFPYATKRFYHLYGTNNLDTPFSSFDKKRYRPDYPMDEIDLSHFPIGSKRSQDSYPLVPRNLL